jgi:hypothetical protein
VGWRKARPIVRWATGGLIFCAVAVLLVTDRPRGLYRKVQATAGFLKRAAVRLSSSAASTASHLKKETAEPLCMRTMSNLLQVSNLFYAREALKGKSRYPVSAVELKKTGLLLSDPVCLAGGRYVFDGKGGVRCTVHGIVTRAEKKNEKPHPIYESR